MNDGSLTLKQIRVFTAVAREGSLGRAAEQLFITKSAVSMSLQQLEATLGEPLFDRIKNRLQLNARGRQLQPLALELLQRSCDMIELFNSDGAGLTVKIGSSHTIGSSLMPRLLARLDGGLVPRLSIRNSGELVDQLAAFELDLAFIEADVVRPWLHREPWLVDQMQVICAPEHPLASRSGLQPADLAGYSWVLREAMSGTRSQFDKRLAVAMEDYQVALEVNSNEGIVNAVVANLGIGFLSSLSTALAVAAGRLKVLDMQAQYPRQLYLAYHREKYQSASLQAFIARCRVESRGLDEEF
ncbi:DNA-binding transcriptional LysR family regulator [Sinobacterium caligoides]|uniref:DNA-binding transcriptional LysR family regulator n=1 Tax=Sinobacterium caligoides TaxID=933926 RepID=A0A3N2DHM7_9GAMM|nr:LysR family transcriptional regulator [Sinobacterium caligoides]ROR98894.1 DNA-binding transcriptional LysR family regulator [Sinobacterium caligoides]